MMVAKRHSDQVDARYLELVRAFPLRVIRDDAELDRAIEVVDEPIDRSELTPAEQDYLAMLGRLIEDYEHEHVTLPEASGVDVLRQLMDERALLQSDLADIFGTKTIVSEVLSGKRQLALSHIRKLSEYFHVPADVFID